MKAAPDIHFSSAVFERWCQGVIFIQQLDPICGVKNAVLCNCWKWTGMEISLNAFEK